jgi:hypothetical protein
MTGDATLVIALPMTEATPLAHNYRVILVTAFGGRRHHRGRLLIRLNYVLDRVADPQRGYQASLDKGDELG